MGNRAARIYRAEVGETPGATTGSHGSTTRLAKRLAAIWLRYWADTQRYVAAHSLANLLAIAFWRRNVMGKKWAWVFASVALAAGGARVWSSRKHQA